MQAEDRWRFPTHSYMTKHDCNLKVRIAIAGDHCDSLCEFCVEVALFLRNLLAFCSRQGKIAAIAICDFGALGYYINICGIRPICHLHVGPKKTKFPQFYSQKLPRKMDSKTCQKCIFLFSLNLLLFPRKRANNVVSTRESRQQTGLKAMWHIYIYIYIHSLIFCNHHHKNLNPCGEGQADFNSVEHKCKGMARAGPFCSHGSCIRRMSETPTTTTSQKSIALCLPFVLQYASNLYCSAFGAPTL